MQNAQLKKILIITCCLLVGVGVLFIRWYIKSNIDRHSVYYVMNISHGRDAHPEFAMLLDNIDSMEQPEKKKVRYKPESGASGVFSDRFYIYNGANVLNDEEPILIKEDEPQYSTAKLGFFKYQLLLKHMQPLSPTYIIFDEIGSCEGAVVFETWW